MNINQYYNYQQIRLGNHYEQDACQEVLQTPSDKRAQIKKCEGVIKDMKNRIKEEQENIKRAHNSAEIARSQRIIENCKNIIQNNREMIKRRYEDIDVLLGKHKQNQGR